MRVKADIHLAGAIRQISVSRTLYFDTRRLQYRQSTSGDLRIGITNNRHNPRQPGIDQHYGGVRP
jgi:hypothetical protein